MGIEELVLECKQCHAIIICWLTKDYVAVLFCFAIIINNIVYFFVYEYSGMANIAGVGRRYASSMRACPLYYYLNKLIIFNYH